MKRFVDWNKWLQNEEVADVESSLKLFSWRIPTSSYTEQYLCQNQNAIDHQNKNIATSHPPLSNSLSPSIHFTTENPTEVLINANNNPEKIDSHSSKKSVIITRRSSKPSRHESVLVNTSEIRQRQQDRYRNYSHRLGNSELYSLIVSSDGVACHGTNCQPSVFHASYRCQLISSEKDNDTFEKSLLMNDQTIKQNISYISLTNLSNIIDHEPNVSRKDSNAHSSANSLMHKPSLLLADIFNRMTHEQRTKSIAELTKLHEKLSKSNISINKLHRTASLPNLSKNPTTLHSVTSLVSQGTTANTIQTEAKLSSSSSLIEPKLINKNITISNHERTSTEPSSISDKSNTNTSNSHELSSKIDETSTQLVNYTDPKEVKTIEPSSNSIISSLSDTTQQSHHKTKSEKNDQSNPQTNFDYTSSSSYRKATDHAFPSKSSANDENEIENSSNDISDHFFQPDTTTVYKSVDTINKEFNRIKQVPSLLETIEEVSQPSKSSDSHLKNPTLFTSSAATSTKPVLITPSPIIDGDTSLITRTTTASTNLTSTDDDDDEQAKLINEQLKRSSLGLARDSLELLRNQTPHRSSSEEQLTSHIDINNTPCKRKSVLKSHLVSSDNLPTPQLISYVAIDDVNDDKRPMEKEIRRRSSPVDGSTVISCTSPKPKRDSLTLLQERYSGSMSPHSGIYHLPSSDSKHVEFIREPGDTITPALHIGRGTKSKQPSSKQITPTFSNDHHYYYHHFSGHTLNPTERSKSELSISDSQQRFEPTTHSRCTSLDSVSRHQTSQVPLTSTTVLSIATDDMEEEKVCLNKSDYDEMVRLIMTPLSTKKKNYSVKTTTTTKQSIASHLTSFLNLIFIILSIVFYIFIYIKSESWH